MPRNEARLHVGIWQDEDFLALSATAQRMYIFAMSQADIAHTGVIALRERRWSKTAAGMTVADVEQDIKALCDGRFFVVDEDTEELLVRTFMRNDKVYRQPNVLRAAADSLSLVASPLLRAELARELDIIAGQDDLPKGSVPIVEEMRTRLGNPSRKGSGNPSGNPSDEASEEPTGDPSGKGSAKALGDRGVVTTATTGSPSPVPRSPSPGSPDPIPPSADTATEVPGSDGGLFDGPPSVDAKKTSTTKPRKAANGKAVNPDVGRVVGAYVEGAQAQGRPRPDERLRKACGQQAAALLAEDYDLDDVMAAARRMGERGWKDLSLQMQKMADAAQPNGSLAGARVAVSTSDDDFNENANLGGVSL